MCTRLSLTMALNIVVTEYFFSQEIEFYARARTKTQQDKTENLYEAKIVRLAMRHYYIKVSPIKQ